MNEEIKETIEPRKRRSMLIVKECVGYCATISCVPRFNGRVIANACDRANLFICNTLTIIVVKAISVVEIRRVAPITLSACRAYVSTV